MIYEINVLKEICETQMPGYMYYYVQGRINDGRYNGKFKNYYCELKTDHDGPCKCDEYEWVNVTIENTDI